MQRPVLLDAYQPHRAPVGERPLPLRERVARCRRLHQRGWVKGVCSIGCISGTRTLERRAYR